MNRKVNEQQSTNHEGSTATIVKPILEKIEKEVEEEEEEEEEEKYINKKKLKGKRRREGEKCIHFITTMRFSLM